ncbi:MAG: hypothetical protein ACOCQD_00310 [archaeon]
MAVNSKQKKNKKDVCSDEICQKDFIKQIMDDMDKPLTVNPADNYKRLGDLYENVTGEDAQKIFDIWEATNGTLYNQPEKERLDVASTWITNYELELKNKHKQIDDLQSRLARQKKENNRLSELTRKKGVNMEDKDMEILTNKIDKILDEKVGKLDKKVGEMESGYKQELNNLSEKVNKVLGEIRSDINSMQSNQLAELSNEIQEIKNYTDQSCKNGQCSIDEMKTLQQRAEELKNKYDELTQNINGINNNLNNTYQGINELREELGMDVDVECPYEDCGAEFNSEKNQTKSGLLVCPVCGRSAQMSDE